MKSIYLLFIFFHLLHHLIKGNQTRSNTLPTPERLRICLEQEWACYSGECISKEYVCDGDYDCSDKSDEKKCGTKCEPNEFKCSDGKCIRLVWKCDGFSDCSDGLDEYQCEQNKNDLVCRYDEYACSDNDQCIPKDFQCDLVPDCKDFSDEIGCSPPVIVEHPPETLIVIENSNVSLTCRSIGKPVPLIYWTFNGDELPNDPRIVTSSVDGRGILSISNIKISENGSWGCEAINVKDSAEASNNCQIWVKPNTNICSPSYFNGDDQVSTQCLKCFCFDLTEDCHSSFMTMVTISLVDNINVVILQENENLSYIKIDSFQIKNEKSSALPFLNQFKITFESISSKLFDNSFIYWSLPKLFLGNQLNSYGGYLKFNFNYHAPLTASYLSLFDVIISGNDIILYHVMKNRHHSNNNNMGEVRFLENEWTKDETCLRINLSKNEIATRRDIMQVLANLDFIYIRASFDQTFLESSINNVRLDTAVLQNLNEGKPAVFIEKCNCPTGHIGNSCEKCAPGYFRPQNDLFVKCIKLTLPCFCNNHSNKCDQVTGQCINCLHNTGGFNCEKCIRGYYGNATIGTPTDCQPCPCPYITLSNNLTDLWSAGFPAQWFSPTCSLDASNDIICNTCPIGYEGKRCEKCAPGYFVDLTLKDKICNVKELNINNFECDPIGSLSKFPNELTGQCQCKPLVTGFRCDQCKVNSFYLNNESPNGCIDCFCMGVTKSCSSSSLFKDTVLINFNETNTTSQMALIDPNRSIYLDSNLKIIELDGISHLTFENTFNNQFAIYYWSLPSNFLGNKLTSYGGRLNYTLFYRLNKFGSLNSEPDVQMNGNGITLFYYYRTKLIPELVNVISVSFFENHWSRNDKRPLIREDFMLVLANIEYILIKATHSSEIISTSIGELSMDISSETLKYSKFLDNNEAMLTVEQCQCPMGYRGLSCQYCDIGFTRISSYNPLSACVLCFCNGHSSDCDPNTGVCKNCLHNTVGEHCEKCAPSFIGNATQGSPEDCQLLSQSLPCQCDKRGSLTKECDIDQQCICKANVEGRNCNNCKFGYFNLDENNEAGCSACYCFDVTDQCHSSTYYQHQIKMDLNSNLYHDFFLTNRYSQESFYDKILTFPDLNEVHFTYPNSSTQYETLYWSLPEIFLGNKLTSYGGILEYTQYFTSEINATPFSDVDIELISQGLKIFHINNPVLSLGNLQTFQVRLIEKNWQLVDQDTTRPAKKEEIFQVLVQLEAILIRASFHSKMKETLLKDVSLTVAVPEKQNTSVAVSVEQCKCPKGYFGLSCEQCDFGYIRDVNYSKTLKCIFCNCNSHSESCDTTGRCLECLHNTIGDHCEKCAPGFFGNAKRGSPDSCKPCPCPLTVLSNSFSKTCYQDTDHQATCDKCFPGYVGRNCEKCASGYFGNPLKIGSKCLPLPKTLPDISVKIDEPKTRKILIGSSISLRCTGHTLSNDSIFNFVWTKEGGSLPSHATEASGLLSLNKVSSKDGGVYVCTGSDLQNVAQDKINIIINTHQDYHKLNVFIEPSQQTVSVGSDVEFKCKVEGYIKPKIYWQKGETQMNLNSITNGSVLKLKKVSKVDEDEYYCIATNTSESSMAKASLFVVESKKFISPSLISITPTKYIAQKGEKVKFYCKSEDSSMSKFVWSFSNGSLPKNIFQEKNFMIIPSAADQYQGEYTCTASNAYEFHSAKAWLFLKTFKKRPQVRIEPHRLTVSVGRTATLRCIVIGDPPPFIIWARIQKKLTERHKVDKNILTIEDTKEKDQGIYLCKATNSEGFDQALAILMIEKMEEPLVEIKPVSSHLVSLGENAYFECHILMGFPKPVIEWSKVDGSPLSSQTQVVNKSILKFNRVAYQDDGDYICNATNFFGSCSSIASLHIQNRVRVNILQKNPYRVRQGDKVILDCIAEGRVHLSMEWRKQRNSFSETNVVQQDGKFRLIIDGASTVDSGFYTCSASSGSEKFQKSIQLIVENVEQNEPEIFVENKLIIAQINSTVEIRCFVYADNVKFNISWKREKGEMDWRFKAENGILRIEKIQKNDTGIYSCTSSIGHKLLTDYTKLGVIGTWSKAPPKVLIEPLIQYGKPGDDIYFNCLIEGDEPIIVYWSGLKENRFKQDFSSKLYLKNIDYNDGGKYHCIAINAAGKTEAISELIVSNHYTNQNELKKNVKVFSESNIEIDCPTVFNFANNISWSFDKNLLPNNAFVSNNQLWIRSAKLNNAGKYICRIGSEYGVIVQESVLVTVQDHPSVRMEIISSHSNLTLGDQLRLKCMVFGKQNPLINWSKLGNIPFLDNVQLMKNILYINKIRAGNGGFYRCSTWTFSGVINRDYSLYTYAYKQTAKEGSNTVLYCPAKTDDIKWLIKSNKYSRIQVKKFISILNVQKDDAGLYICREITNNSTIEHQIVLIVESIVASFDQKPISYVSLPPLSEAYLKFSIEILFKPHQTDDGLILYSGQFIKKGDFISLGLANHHLVFKFELGSGVVTLTSLQSITQNVWHWVKIVREMKEAVLFVDSQKKVIGHSKGKFVGLDLLQPIYVGALPDFNVTLNHVYHHKGFVGCISSFKLQEVEQNLMSTIDSHGLTKCDSCSSNFCLNGGTCQESGSIKGWCICSPGFSGLNCQKSGEFCFPEICGKGHCIQKANDQVECSCPMNKAGPFCKENLEIQRPYFDGFSFAAYEIPSISVTNFTVKIQFKPQTLRNGLLVFTGQNSESSQDFMAIVIKNKSIEFIFDTGSGSSFIRSNLDVSLNEWTLIKAERKFNQGILSIGRTVFKGSSPGHTKGINLRIPLYLGGVNFNLPSVLGIDQGFNGCIKELEINGHKINLIEDAIDSSNVKNCKSVHF